VLKKAVLGTVAGLTTSILIFGSAFAASNPAGTGQPGTPTVSCGTGNASQMPNGFSTAGFANAVANYAGSSGTPSANDANSTHAVVQYDIACYQQTQNH